MNKQILYDAISTYGTDAQKIMAMEEMSELIKELSKNIRGNKNRINIAEEIADVEIMLEQMKIIFDISAETVRWKAYKMARLEERLNDEYTTKARNSE